MGRHEHLFYYHHAYVTLMSEIHNEGQRMPLEGDAARRRVSPPRTLSQSEKADLM
jgi:hypothetical protein